jgi:tetratricopeptide (TPR) repeat protein
MQKLTFAAKEDPGKGTAAASAVINIMITLYLCSANYDENQEMITRTVLHCQKVLNSLKKDPSLENNPEVCAGYLTRPRLHFRFGDVYFLLRNSKEIAKQFKEALKIDPSLTNVRVELVVVHTENGFKDAETNIRSWKQILEESHPDARWLGAANAYLAILLLDNPLHGTYEEACNYADAMKAAYRRHFELYKRRSDLGGDESHLTEAVQQRFQLNSTMISKRKFLDTIPKWQLEQMMLGGAGHEKSKYGCMKCGKPDKINGVKLRKCGACKQIFYCSVECQEADWVNHKASCKIFRKSAKK